MLFSTFRGVATGGGTWGSLMVVVVAFIAFALGEYFLAKFHVRQPRVTSFLGLCLTSIVIMAVFIEPVYSWWAWLILPALGALTFALSHRVIAMADSAR
jgi:O-antigen/teichoic acid export membrane protein